MEVKISQKRLEFLVATGFSLLIIVLSNTKLGYIPISGYRSIDMGIIPAIFAAMIGGYRVGIPVAIIWAICAFTNQSSNLQVYTLYGLIVNRIVLVTIAFHAYKVCKKYYKYSPANVYRAVIAAVTAKNIVANAILIYMLSGTKDSFELNTWISYTAQQYVLELALCSLAMGLLIKHLRQVHILNGVKRREKAKAESKALEEY